MRSYAPGLILSTLVVPSFSHPTSRLPLGLRQAAPQFEITALSENLPVGPPYGTGDIETTLTLTIAYPDPIGTDATLSTTCSYTWPVGVLNGTNWTACGDPALEWRLPASNYTSGTNFLVELFETITATDGAVSFLDGSHLLTMTVGSPADPNAYLSCIQYGKFQPDTCTLGGPLAQHSGPVVVPATVVTQRPI